MSRQHFTPIEVNRAIPELERIIKYLRGLESEIRDKEWRLKEAKVEAGLAGHRVDEATFLQEEAEIDFTRILAEGQFARVRQLGGEIKGGYLVDFPAVIDGREVLLCWKPGETAVGWYHGLHEGMSGRRRIPDDWPAPEEPDKPGE